MKTPRPNWLELSIDMDILALKIKQWKPEYTPEQIADKLRDEVERIEQEMTDGTF